MRVVFDRASELFGVDQNKGFLGKLDQLHKDGHISAHEKKALDALTEAGNAAAHRGWEPDMQQLNNLLSIMEHFVRGLSMNERARTLRGSIPPRQRQRAPDDCKELPELINFPPPKPSRNSSL
jgi:hypothetical protein